MHFKAADDAAHDRNVPYRVAYLQAADALLRQLAARLWAHEAAGGARYALCVTGDHSTPVLYGDHSNEPVPVAVAHLADLVAAMGGPAAVAATPLGPIRTPEFAPPVATPGEGDAAAFAREAPAPAAAVAGDAVRRFDEVAAAAGGLGRFCGAALMPLLRAFSDTRAETDGAQRTQQ